MAVCVSLKNLLSCKLFLFPWKYWCVRMALPLTPHETLVSATEIYKPKSTFVWT